MQLAFYLYACSRVCKTNIYHFALSLSLCLSLSVAIVKECTGQRDSGNELESVQALSKQISFVIIVARFVVVIVAQLPQPHLLYIHTHIHMCTM